MRLNRKKKKILAALAALALALPSAQNAWCEAAGPYSIGFDLNFPTPAGATSDVLKNGFGFGFNLGYRPEESPLGVRLDVSHANWDLTTAVLNQIDRADTGWASMWGFDLSALLTPPHAETIRPYIQAGPGFYYERAEASRFQGGGGVVCDPWFGCWEVNNTQDVAEWSTWRLGWMGGAGLNIEFHGGGALYLQAQYHYINNSHQATEFVPFAIGFRQSF